MKAIYKSKKANGRRMDEHRWLMEQHVGRRLQRFEFVHHKNGDKRDNRIENLEIVTPKQHAVEHGQWKYPTSKPCAMCGVTFTPHPTKRKRAKTCSRSCRYALASQTNRREDAPYSKWSTTACPSRVKSRPQVATEVIRAYLETTR